MVREHSLREWKWISCLSFANTSTLTCTMLERDNVSVPVHLSVNKLYVVMGFGETLYEANKEHSWAMVWWMFACNISAAITTVTCSISKPTCSLCSVATAKTLIHMIWAHAKKRFSIVPKNACAYLFFHFEILYCLVLECLSQVQCDLIILHCSSCMTLNW